MRWRVGYGPESVPEECREAGVAREDNLPNIVNELGDEDFGGAVDDVLYDSVYPCRGGRGAVFHGGNCSSSGSRIRMRSLFWWEQGQTRKPTNGRSGSDLSGRRCRLNRKRAMKRQWIERTPAASCCRGRRRRKSR
ncbi:hypothetical protein FF1_034252 [Malus domestica]